jgi:hypothetical protein
LRLNKATVAVTATLLALSACGGPGRTSERERGVSIAGIDGRVSIIRPGQDVNAAYSQGLDLKNQGNCAGAILKLRPVANLGPGYENAQTALGSCLLESGAKDKELSADYLDGLMWLRRAGDAGWPEAQGVLAGAHAFGPATIRNGEESAYWLTLYQTNPSKSRIGFSAMGTADVAAIEKSLTPAQKETGKTRAAQWQRKVWIPAPQQQPEPPAKR